MSKTYMRNTTKYIKVIVILKKTDSNINGNCTDVSIGELYAVIIPAIENIKTFQPEENKDQNTSERHPSFCVFLIAYYRYAKPLVY